MKTHKIIVVLLILLGVSAYANDNEVEGFTEDDCDGDSHVATSYSELKDMHESNDNEWEFESYWYTNDKKKCLIFEEDMEEVIVVGQKLPGSSNGTYGSTIGGGTSSSGSKDYAPTIDEVILFDEEKQEAIKECWQAKLEDSEVIKKALTRTKAKWRTSSETGAKWKFVASGENAQLAGITLTELPEDANSVEDVSITITIYPWAIGAEAIANDYKLNHLIMYHQMHEYVHAVQIAHERDDGDKHYVPIPEADRPIMELEAYEILELIWQEFFNSSAPYTVPEDELPEDFDSKRDRYYDLYSKKKDGNLSPEEKQEFESLKEYFDDI
ncbi:MAG: hypothetical protein F4039_04680, partial [Gammaproteobacteria bacterium]|nr:hypothetical protein [Gammaproteobacteria bacterium]